MMNTFLRSLLVRGSMVFEMILLAKRIVNLRQFVWQEFRKR